MQLKPVQLHAVSSACTLREERSPSGFFGSSSSLLVGSSSASGLKNGMPIASGASMTAASMTRWWRPSSA